MIDVGRAPTRRGVQPTVVLVHGAFTGTSTWSGVIETVAASGWVAFAVATPLRTLEHDAAYVAAVSDALTGPVLLVGHGYGGAVITVAGAAIREPAGLVYVAGFAVGEPECSVDLLLANPDDAFLRSLRPRPLQLPGGSATELHVDREQFRAVLAADLADGPATTAAASQRPITAAALEGRPPGCGWRSLPCWSLIPQGDRVIDLETHRRLADRMDARSVEVAGSHLVPVTRPAAVAALISDAMAAVS